MFGESYKGVDMSMSGPASLTAAHVLTLCNELVPDVVPLVVGCEPQADASANDCFALVERFVQREGGECVIGWALWEMPHVLLEAEFHAVWRRPMDGALVDLNPRDLHFSHIHFLPDVSRSYEGRQVDNLRRPLCNDAKVKQFVYLKKRQFELANAGKLADVHGAITADMVSPRHIKDYNNVVRQLNALVPALNRIAQSRNI